MENIFIGFDCHKDSHYCVAINGEGKVKLSFELANTYDQMNNCGQQFLRMVEECKLVIGVEGSRSYGLHLASCLKELGFEVLEVGSNLTRSRRRSTWGRGKSDEVDALIVARTIRDEHEKLQELDYDDATEVLINLSRRREDLVHMRSNELKRLHCQLMSFDPEYKSKGDITKQSVLNYWLGYCKRNIPKEKNGLKASRLHCIKSLIYTIIYLQQCVETIESQMEAAKTKDVKILMSLSGIGLISACKIMSSIGNIKRFKNSSKLASYAGLSPINFASGRFSKDKANIRGDRKLNSAFYAVALSASRVDAVSKAYYEKKQEEGKSKKQALRYLARRLLKVVYALLSKGEFYSYSADLAQQDILTINTAS